jgi:hypothetical protein
MIKTIASLILLVAIIVSTIVLGLLIFTITGI